MYNLKINIEFFIVYLLFMSSYISVCVCKQVPTANAISCFVCNSRNHKESYCFDPFHPINSTYEQHCRMGKENHIGQFPAHYCIKIYGENIETKERLVVRMCSLTSMDNQCGEFKFENETLNGCILTCNRDGCNSAIINKLSKLKILSSSLFFTLLYILLAFKKF